ncbi:MAG: NAD(P)-dependent oxidoreductase [Prevotella sp.]|nr:NAD(P)-dependent oxidoreductase [Prevotella sp.]
MKKILITGASGFIGSAIVNKALDLGMEVWAAVRHSSSKQYLQDKRINFIELDLSSAQQMTQALSKLRFDYVVHAAGLTKALRQADFFSVNTEGTKHLVEALKNSNQELQRFVYMSSLSVFGAIKEQMPYQPIKETDTPRPNTAYGKSKWEAEKFLDGLEEAGYDLPYVILRPTGVYGPREHDYYMMAKSIKEHVDFAAGWKRQDITFVYVDDVVQAVFLALDHGKKGRKYFLSDGNVYQSSTFSNLIHQELGCPWWIRVKAPIALLHVICKVCDAWGHLTGRLTALNNDKYNILRQRNWRCDIRPAVDELGFKPQWDLARGVRETIEWYKANGWL